VQSKNHHRCCLVQQKRICLGYLNFLSGAVKPLYPHSKNIAKNDLKSPKQRVPRASKKVREVFLETQRLWRARLKAAEGWAVGMQAGAGWGAAFHDVRPSQMDAQQKEMAYFSRLLSILGKTEILT
jgi:hypothetical protein